MRQLPLKGDMRHLLLDGDMRHLLLDGGMRQLVVDGGSRRRATRWVMTRAAVVLAFGCVATVARATSYPTSEPHASESAPPALEAAGFSVRGTTPTLIDVSDWRMVDWAPAGGVELFVATKSGVLEVFAFAADATEPKRAAPGRLPDPTHCAIALEPLEADGRVELLVASARGVEHWVPDAQGGFTGNLESLSTRARQRVRTGRPVFAPLAQDVNGDGRTDLVVPNGNALEVWIQTVTTGEARGRSFTKAATVQVRVSSSESTDAADLSDDLESSLMIPGLRMTDVNGDGRKDLLVEDGEKRAFHLVRADGAIPPTPDVAVDLSIFRDTTPRGELAPGRVLAGSDKAVYVSRDLDGDTIPDAVIAQGRKVWVFHGSQAGPQFTEPSTVLKAADDVTAAQVLNLDDDGKPDLLLVKVQVPSLATLLRGLVSSWEVELDAVGYRNSGDRKFDTTPAWRSTIRFEVPAILTIVKDPEKLLSRFEDVGKKFRSPVEADFDGDAAVDVALVSEDGRAIEVWRGDANSKLAERESSDDVFRRVLFQDENKDWDVDRLIQWLSSFGERRVALVTGGRAAESRFELRDPAEWRLASLQAADVDGDGRAEIVSCYARTGDGGEFVFDVLAWK